MIVFQKYMWIFFIYSIGGWIMESIRCWIRSGKFVNRGFLIGPYLPIYGVGLVLITLCLEKYVNDILILFCMSIVVCGLLEYFTSWIMEKVFRARWWDYHDRKFNINGRVCLENLIPFGVAGTILLKWANPFLLELIYKMQPNTSFKILVILSIIISVDALISFTVIGNLKKTAKEVENKSVKDDTEEITKKVKEITTQKAEEIKENVQNMSDDILDSIAKKAEQTRKDIVNAQKVFKSNVKEFGREIHYSREKMRNKLSDRVILTKNFTNMVKENFSTKWINRRFLNAFPNLQIKLSKNFIDINKSNKNKR